MRREERPFACVSNGAFMTARFACATATPTATYLPRPIVGSVPAQLAGRPIRGVPRAGGEQRHERRERRRSEGGNEHAHRPREYPKVARAPSGMR